MGKESSSRKSRTCKTCGQSFHTNAIGIQEHADLCLRLKAINIEVPGIVLQGEVNGYIDK